MRIREYQDHVAQMYTDRGYKADLPTLGLGLCEEAGEVAGAINNLNPLFVRRADRSSDSLEHELKDLFVYMCAIANVAGIDLESALDATAETG